MKDLIWKSDFYAYLVSRNLLERLVPGMAELVGDYYFWMPLMAALCVAMVMREPFSAARNLFFFLSGSILAYQSCALLAVWLVRPSPIAMVHLLLGQDLPLSRLDDALSFPDWASGAFAAGITYGTIIMRPWQKVTSLLVIASLGAFMVFRSASGMAFPSDILIGYLAGAFIGWVMATLSQRIGKIVQVEESEIPTGE